MRFALRGAVLLGLLIGCSSRRERADDASRPPLPLGERVYKSYCAGCHGDTGHGDGPAGGRFDPPPTNLVRGPWKKGDSPEAIRASVIEGVAPAMAPLRTLTKEELDALVAHVRAFAGNTP